MAFRVSLTPRDVRAGMHAKCSDVSLDVDVVYEADPPVSSTDIQRRIEALVQLPDPALLVRIGGIELYFRDGLRLSNVGFYADFAAAETEDLVPLSDPPPVWITFPDLDVEENDRFSVEAAVTVSVDRRRGAVRLRLPDAGHDQRAYLLGDGLVAWVNGSGHLVGLAVHGIDASW